jgi:DNA-binding beta-propeller fold protein YncE
VNPAVKDKINTERRIFALAFDQDNHLLYMGNALDGSITVLDTRSGKAIKTLQLSDNSDPKKLIHPREAVLDKKHQRLYISGMGGKGKGLLWVVDTQKQQLTKTLEGMDPVGFAVDAEGDKVYAVTGSGELVTLDGKTSALLSRVKVDPKESRGDRRSCRAGGLRAHRIRRNALWPAPAARWAGVAGKPGDRSGFGTLAP